MTTSILDPEELLQKITGEKGITAPATSDQLVPGKPVSLQDLFDRAKELFTPEEAEALARRIEEGREQAYD
jgi:hypothetical protein